MKTYIQLIKEYYSLSNYKIWLSEWYLLFYSIFFYTLLANYISIFYILLIVIADLLHYICFTIRSESKIRLEKLKKARIDQEVYIEKLKHVKPFSKEWEQIVLGVMNK